MLYLNPSLEIYSLKEAGNDMGYHRDQQVVVLERQLLPVIPFLCISPIKVKLMRRYATWMCLLKSRHNVGRYDPESDVDYSISELVLLIWEKTIPCYTRKFFGTR